MGRGIVARPSKLTPAVSAAICESVRGGVYIETACQANNISTSTYYRWLDKADDPNAGDEFREFRDASARARAEVEARHVSLIDQAARGPVPGDWRAAAWYLERSFPTRYGRQERIEVDTGGEGGAITLVGLARLMGVPEDDDDE